MPNPYDAPADPGLLGSAYPAAQQPLSVPLSSGPSPTDLQNLMQFIHQQSGWAVPKAAPPISLDSIDALTKLAQNGGGINPGQNAVGYWDGSNIHLLNVWNHNNQQDNVTLMRELSRSMMPQGASSADAERKASAVQEAWLKQHGLTWRDVGLSPGNLLTADK